MIYAESFNWVGQPGALLEILWGFNILSDVDRGYDTTFTPAGDDEAQAALSKLRTYQGLEKIARADLHKILVRDDYYATIDHTRCYIACAVMEHDNLFGRSTYGYIAYDVASACMVYMKDFWYTDLAGIPKEGDVYRGRATFLFHPKEQL